MTNREWLNNLDDREMAKLIVPLGCECEYCIINANCDHVFDTCYDKMAEWLKQTYEKPMPKIKAGDYILYEYSDIVYRAFCISDKLIYLIDRGRCTKFDSEIKQRIVAIKRYNITKETMEDIWSADNGKTV